MKKQFAIVVAILSLSIMSTYAKGGYEVCKGTTRNGETITVVGDYSDADKSYTIEVNAQGERLTYTDCEDTDAGDVADGYKCADNGGLKMTFFDEDNSASGYSSQFGAFKLSCQDNNQQVDSNPIPLGGNEQPNPPGCHGPHSLAC